MDLTGEVKRSGLPCHGHGPLAAAVKKLWLRRAIQAAVHVVLLQWVTNLKWLHSAQRSCELNIIFVAMLGSIVNLYIIVFPKLVVLVQLAIYRTSLG